MEELTPGNNYKLLNQSFHYDLRKLFCTIVDIWNRLPHSAVAACTGNAFKSRLRKFWRQPAGKFDFTADLASSGFAQKSLQELISSETANMELFTTVSYSYALPV